jgi:hypothetical protein
VPPKDLTDDLAEVLLDHRHEPVVADVSRGDDKQPMRRPAQQVTVSKVTILGDDDPVFRIGDSVDLAVWRPIAGREI